jgi:hypothetical protein
MKKLVKNKTFSLRIFLTTSLLLCYFQTNWGQLIDLTPTLEFFDPDSQMKLSSYDLIDSTNWRKINSVTECTISKHKYKKDEIEVTPIKEMMYKFNSEGVLSEIVNGKRKIENKINDNNQIIKCNVLNTEKGDTTGSKSIEFYNDGKIKRIVESVHLIGKAWSTSITDISYNENGKLLEIFLHTKDGTYEYFRTSYRYDNSGRLSEKQTCQRIKPVSNVATIKEFASSTFTEGQCSYKDEYIYSEKGNLIKSVYYHPDLIPLAGFVRNNNPQGFFLYECNDKNMITQISEFDIQNKLLSKKTFSYDENGNLLQFITYDSFDQVQSKIMQSYNERNQVTMMTEINSENVILSMLGYKYDDKGVRIKITEYDTTTRKPRFAYQLKYK